MVNPFRHKETFLKKVSILIVISFSISLLLYFSNILYFFELKSFDIFSRVLNPVKAPEDIIIIRIDQESIDALSKEGVNWPWPRQIYAPIIEHLSEASAVFIDLLYSEPSSYGVEDDAIFANAVKKASNVYLPFFLSKNRRPLKTEERNFLANTSITALPNGQITYYSVTAPIDPLKESAKGFGNVSINPDDDGVYRRIPLSFQIEDISVPNLVFSYFTKNNRIKYKNGKVYHDEYSIPLSKGKVLLRYYRESFKTFSSMDILNAHLTKELSGTLPGQDFFKNKFVFIGPTAAGLMDLKPTSISSVSTGVHINATFLANLKTHDFFKPVCTSIVLFFMLAIVMTTSCFVISQYSLAKNLAVFAVLFIAIIVICGILFSSAYYFPAVFPVVALIVSYIATTVYSYASEGRERLFIRKTFSRYMDKKIVDYVLQHPDIVKPGGQRTRITVSFADIAGFTTISEQSTPESVSMILHMVLNALTEVIIAEQGVIDKYIGDCVMAFWGAPLASENDEINGCNAALKCISSIEDINIDLVKTGLNPISIRVGINSGDVIAGNLGSDRLFDYTVIGDAVNLASRLESVNKIFGTNIIISENTLSKTGNLFFVRELGLVEVKGKAKPVRIYELIGTRTHIKPEKAELVNLYNEGLACFASGKFPEGIEIFGNLLKKYPHDGPSMFYIKKCEELDSCFDLTNDFNIIKLVEK